MKLLFALLFIASCASTNSVQKERYPGPHHGHVFPLKDLKIEVVKVDAKTFKFYFFDEHGQVIEPHHIAVGKALLDPPKTKANHSLHFLREGDHFEAVLNSFELPTIDYSKISAHININGAVYRPVLVFN